MEITFGKPATYNGQKRIIVNPYLPNGHVELRQTPRKTWKIYATYSGFNKNGHYTSDGSYMHDSGWTHITLEESLRATKIKITEILNDPISLDRLNKIIDVYVDDIKRSE